MPQPARLTILILVILLTSCTSPSPTPLPPDTSTPIPEPTRAPATPTAPPPESEFVIIHNGKFYLHGERYAFVGTNFWQGMNLGSNSPRGNRDLLLTELDDLQQMGITNLRVMASSEGPNTEPYRMTPALMISPGEYDPQVLDSLDFLLAEMGKRDMKAVMVLNNYWQWSGGMAQYVSWHTHTPIPYPGDWGEFMNYAADFYLCEECQTWYRAHIAFLITRTNSYTDLTYRDDPTIFSWELANEPRRYHYPWIDDTSEYIKSLDPNHLVTTGAEGSPPGEDLDFTLTHDSPDIDYVTIHIWPQNWGWYNPENPSTYARAEANARAYFQTHANYAAQLRKPLVLEEFGLARDWDPLHDINNPASPTTTRDQFYAAMFEEVLLSFVNGGPAAGSNFWAWAGDSYPGDDWVGDPPHETPGWYSVYATDEETLAIITTHVAQMANPSDVDLPVRVPTPAPVNFGPIK